jgi:hypothetical protein
MKPRDGHVDNLSPVEGRPPQDTSPRSDQGVVCLLRVLARQFGRSFLLTRKLSHLEVYGPEVEGSGLTCSVRAD